MSYYDPYNRRSRPIRRRVPVTRPRTRPQTQPARPPQAEQTPLTPAVSPAIQPVEDLAPAPGNGRTHPAPAMIPQPAEPERATEVTDDADQAESELWKTRYLRLQADLKNTKKRAEKRYEMEAKQTKQQLILDMLPLADNLQAALLHAEPAVHEDKNLHEGVSLTLRAFLESLNRQGVAPIAALGTEFDPTLHEAVGEVSAPGSLSGTVVQVMQEGYTLDNRLLRPARVLVAE